LDFLLGHWDFGFVWDLVVFGFGIYFVAIASSYFLTVVSSLFSALLVNPITDYRLPITDFLLTSHFPLLTSPLVNPITDYRLL